MSVGVVPPPSRPPARPLTFWMAVALVMGNMIGSGIFLLPASLARFGGVSLIGWLITAFDTAGRPAVALAAAAVMVLTLAILVLHRYVEQRIEHIGRL